MVVSVECDLGKRKTHSIRPLIRSRLNRDHDASSDELTYVRYQYRVVLVGREVLSHNPAQIDIAEGHQLCIVEHKGSLTWSSILEDRLV